MTGDWAAAIVAFVAVATSLVFGLVMYRLTGRATTAAENSAAASDASAKAAAEAVRIERERRHDELTPNAVRVRAFIQEPNRRAEVDGFAVIENSSGHTYSIAGDRVFEGGSKQSIHPFDLHPGRAEKIYVGTEGMALPERLELRFTGDCPCEGTSSGGHWTRSEPVPPTEDWLPLDQNEWFRAMWRYEKERPADAKR